MVEKIDKQGNFPAAPVVRQRLPQPPSTPGSDGRPRVASSSSSSGVDARRSSQAAAEAAPVQIISPELRALLSREVPRLEKEEVLQHGGGVGS